MCVAQGYNDISSSVIVNGSCFSIARSIRQGCPLSALLYVLCIEPLANAIRQDQRIRGLKLPGSAERVRLALQCMLTTRIVLLEILEKLRLR